MADEAALSHLCWNPALRRRAGLGIDHRRICRRAPCEWDDEDDKVGFECILEKITLDPSRNYFAWRKTEQRIESWMEHWQLPIGVAICSEEAGRLLVQLCRRRGWRVPGDVAIIAGTNEETLYVHPRPSLSSTELGYDRVGYEAARLLDQLMDERETGRRPKGADSKPQHIFCRRSLESATKLGQGCL